MGQFLERLSVRVLLVLLPLLAVALLGGLLAGALWFGAADERGPAIALLVGLAILLPVAGLWTAQAVARSRVPGLLEPVRAVVHRAEEYGAGGFALESGAVGARAPLRTGLSEIDALSAVLDRNAQILERALTSERTFASDASHQLRTPLAALLMRLDEIAATESLEEVRSEAELAISQTERLAGVVDELLHRSRAGHADGGRSVSLETVLTALAAEYRPDLQRRGREIVVDGEHGIIVRASASAVSNILATLVENALVHGDGQVTLTTRRSGPSAVIEVRDEGPGIDPALGATIFERAVTSGQGTGLGLAVAREQADTFGGRLELQQTTPPVFALYVSMAPVR